jgi:hypothetical protein
MSPRVRNGLIAGLAGLIIGVGGAILMLALS